MTPGVVVVVQALVRGAIFAGVVGLALTLARVSRASVKLWAWTIVLTAAMVMPLVGRAVPPIPWTLPAAGPLARVATLTSMTLTGEPAPAPASGGVARVGAAVASGVLAARTAGASASRASAGARSWRPSGGALALFIYLTGVLMLATQAARHWYATRRLERGARDVVDAAACGRTAALARAAGLSRVPRLCESDAVRVPVTTSVLRPRIVLPETWRTWTSSRLDAVLTHELAHVARRDALTQRLSLLYRAAAWCSPLGWWLHHHLAELAEQASDDAVLDAGADPADYAEVLVAFLADMRGAREPAGCHVAMARGAVAAERRLDHILSWNRGASMKLTSRLASRLLILAVPIAALTAAIQPSVAAARPQGAAVAAPAVLPAPDTTRRTSPAAVPAPAAPAPAASAPRPAAPVAEAVAPALAAPAASPTAAALQTPAAAPASDRTFGVLLDGATLESTDASRVRDLLDGLDATGAIEVASVGPDVAVLQPLTHDRAAARAAIDQFFQRPPATTPVASDGAPVAAIKTVCQDLAAASGRKALFFVSRGPRIGQTNEVLLRDATNTCNAANVSIYPVDARGMAPDAGPQQRGGGTPPAAATTSGTKYPVPVISPEPRYTDAARLAGIQGAVELQAVVRADGTVGDVRVTKSLDARYGLDAEAVKAAKQWVFKPATRDGAPLPSNATLVMTFRTGPQAPQGQADDDFVKGAYKVDTPGLVAPKATHTVEAKYTADAMRAKMQGLVDVEVVVDADGIVARARVAKDPSAQPLSGPDDLVQQLNDEALKAVGLWTFEPATLNGRPVAALIKLSMPFRLH